MAITVLKNCKFWFDAYDLSGDMNALALTYGADVKDKTTFGSGGAREKLAGIPSGEFSHSGFWNNEPDAQLFTSLGGTNKLMTICPENGSVGDKSFFGNVVTGSYTPQGAVGDIFAFDVNGEFDDALYGGEILLNASAVTTTQTSIVTLLGALSATQKLYLAIHITQISGGDTLQFITTSDDNAGGSSLVTRDTQSAVSSIGTLLVEITGPITDTYWRVQGVKTGSNAASFVASLAIL